MLSIRVVAVHGLLDETIGRLGFVSSIHPWVSIQ
jgi:hypothetical protein